MYYEDSDKSFKTKNPCFT